MKVSQRKDLNGIRYQLAGYIIKIWELAVGFNNIDVFVDVEKTRGNIFVHLFWSG